MRSAVLRLLAILGPVAVGLATSTLLLVDYLRDVPVICAEGGGCDAIKHSVYARPLGVPVPLLGVLGFLALGTVALIRGDRARVIYVRVAAAAAAVGVLLFVLQAKMGTFCPYCVVTDAAALLVGVVALLRARSRWDVPQERRPWVGGGALAFAFLAPLAFAVLKRPILPDVIREELAKAPAGRAVVVDFVDFECPFCRLENADLSPMLAARKDKLVVVRKMVPLTRIHPHALDAARAACCGEKLGKGDAITEALFTAPEDDLTKEGCEKIATSLGLDANAFRACFTDPDTEARIRADRETFNRASVKGDGLPLLFIGEKKLMGAQDPETLTGALDQAIARAGG